MKQVNVKKLLILNLPYLLFVWLFDKAVQAVRLSPGADLSGKLLNLGDGFSQAMEKHSSQFPSGRLACRADRCGGNPVVINYSCNTCG